MTNGLNFWDSSVWTFMIEITLLLGGMMLANMLRRLIKPLRQSLIPSSVVAGFLLLIANAVYKRITGSAMFQSLTLETLTYHGLGLGFVALALKTNTRDKTKHANRDVFDTGVTVVSTYLLQGLLALALTIGLSYVIHNWPASGLLLPMGFGQGPGQAYNWGHIYESATDYAPFAGGTSFGLTVAAMGFVSASIGGVIYLGVMKRKGRIKTRLLNADETEDLSAEMVTRKGEIPMSESLDKLTVQFGLVFLTYMFTYLLMYVVSLGLDRLGGFFSGTVKPLIWGFNFLIGTVCAMLLKAILAACRRKNIVHREYCNNFMLSRIAGFMFDLMVTASIAAISLSAFKQREFVIPLLVICVVGAAVSYLYLNVVAKRIFPTYRDESFLALYGMLTGTASTGVILLREIDPFFDTPAAGNLIYQQLWAIVFGFPMLLLMGLAPQSNALLWITLGSLTGLYIIMNLILFRRSIFRRKDKPQA